MKKYILSLFIFIMILPTLELLTLRKVTGIEQNPSGQIIYFLKDRDFKQQFISPKNNLYSIEIKLKNPDMRNRDPVTFSLSSDNKTLSKLDLNGTNIRDGDWTRFTFEEIPQSENQSFGFTLASNSPPDKAIGVEVNGQNQAAFITFHRIPSRLNLIIDTYQQFSNKLIADKFFLGIWGIFLVALLKSPVQFKN